MTERYMEAQRVYQIVLELNRQSKTVDCPEGKLVDVLEAVEELRDKLYLLLPPKETRKVL